jgi:class 3 adenylate cyclase
VLCGSCGHDNGEGRRFCVECGAALDLRCPSCASPVEAGQRFCGECGTRLVDGPTAPPTPPAAVRKTVTVLFADLGGSTGFGERTDAEIARQVLARYHALLQETVDAHAGTVAKFMGDGMMATFGIPEIAEDDARRAVAAGTDLQTRFEALASDIERRHGETLTLRVGINTGEVVIGEGDADLIGDALNVAARLEKACRPGHVLVGEETWRLTRGDVAYEELGEVSVAGRAQPVAVFEVATESDRAAEEVAAPFVGREPEIERLLSVLDDARAASAARLATVLGSPGVGKTRLSRELCARADAQSVELRCDRAGEATFAPVAQLIRESAGLGDDADADAARAAIGTLLPESEADHARVVDVLAALVGAAPGRSVEETFWAVRRLVEATAAAQPLVVVIDDIQWAEPLLLDLIEHLAEWVTGAAVLLVGLARPELREVRPARAAPRRPVSEVVVLDGLDASATEALAAGLLGTERLPAGLVERLPASTDGNPLFVRELVRMLVDDRVVRRRDDGEWELTIDADAVDVPPTIQSLLGARVERLPATEREVLELASVIGSEFSLGALRELSGDAAVSPLLEAMRRKELVEPTGTYWGDEPVYRFHHVLIRDAAYRRLLKTTRAELHERVAEWTDRNAADLIGEHEAAIAFHYEQAHRYRAELGTIDARTDELARRGAELLTTAAQRALGRDDLASAGALSARALALLPPSDASARADLLTMGCECLLASGNGTAARPLVEELERVAAGDDRLAAWADCFAAQLVGLTDPEGIVAADAQVAAAAETLTALDDGSGQAKAHQVRAGLLAALGRVGDAELELDLALAAARGADDRRRVTAVLGAAPDAALFGPSPVARAGGRCLDVVRLLRITTASPAVEAASNRCQAVLESLRGRFDVSRSMLASARSSLEELGLRHGLAQTELYAGMVEMIAGDPHAAIPPLRAAFDGLGALGVGADAGSAAALLARALLVDGQVDEADEMAAASEQLAGQNLKTSIGWRVARAEVLAARDDLTAAVPLAEQAVEIAAGTDLIIDHADACVALATLRDRAGDAAGARAARADAKRLYDQKGATVPAARLDHAPVVVASTAPESDSTTTTAVSRPENTASRVFAALAEATGSGDDAAGASLADDYVFDDRRRVVNLGTNDSVAASAHGEQARRDGQRVHVPGAVAIRGDRLALCRTIALTDAGDDSSSLAVAEVDERGLLTNSTHFDADDLAAALEELDARYIAGEAAGHADLVRLVAAWVSIFEDGDVDRIRDLVAPDFVWVDHQQLGWGTLGVDQIIELFRALRGVQNAVVVSREVVSGRAIQFSAANHATDAAGGEVLWSFHAVGVADDAGRTTRVEIFAEDDLAGALARFDALGRGSAARPPVENAASRAWAQARAATLPHRVPTVIAIRGERLALCAAGGVTAAGDEDLGYHLVELDAQGRMIATVAFDEGDLDSALTELDARYVAGEGAVHADLVAMTTSWLRASNHFDFDTMRELSDPEFVWVDHRQFGSATLDLDGFIEWQQGYRDIEYAVVIVDLHFEGRVNLVTAMNRARDPDGGAIDWSYYTVGVANPAGQAQRVEMFADDDWDAALARFEELSLAGGPPPLENAASRVDARVIELFAAGADRELTELTAPEFELDDRRHVVNFGITGTAVAASTIRWLREDGFEVATPQVVAIRGDRLVLSRRCRRTPTGDDLTSLAVVEVDEQGRLLGLVQFDDDALEDAVAELDARFIAGEGAENARLLRVSNELGRRHAARDWTGLRELFDDTTVLVDHRKLGWPSGDGGVVVRMFRELVELVPDHRLLYRTQHVEGRAVLTSVNSFGTTRDGSPREWALHAVITVNEAGRLTAFELFDHEDWGAAVARFDELSRVGPRTPEVENAATRRTRRDLDQLLAGRYDDLAPTLRPDFERIDRRHGVAGAPITSAADYLASLRAIMDQFDALSFEPIAVRGERHHLSRVTWGRPDDFHVTALVVFEFDEAGLGVANVTHDEDDLAAAVAELDARYMAGEGAEHAELLTRANDDIAAAATADRDELRSRLSPQFTLVDHRAASWGTRDRDEYLAMQQTYADVVRSFVLQKAYFSERAILATAESRGIDAAGSEFEWRFHSVTVWGDDGRSIRAEVFDDHDWDAALTRFDELAAAPAADARTPEVANASTQALERLLTTAREQRFDELPSLLAPSVERIDHRRGVSAGPTTTAAEYVETLRAAFGQGEVRANHVTPLAVRGDRLSLSLVVADVLDFQIPMLMLHELDAEGRTARMESYDEDDLPAAIGALVDRFIVGEGAPYAAMLRTNRSLSDALADDDAVASAETFAADMNFVDHRRFGIEGSTRGYAAARAEYRDVELSSFATKYYLAPSASLSSVIQRGVDSDGNEATWLLHIVASYDRNSRLRTSEFYDGEDWIAALTRFDELAAEPPAEPRTPAADNECTRVHERLVRLLAQPDDASITAGVDLLAPGIVQTDRRRGVAAPDLVGRDARLDNLAAVAATFGELDVEPLAVRGERLALMRWTITAEGGFTVTGYDVNELDDDGRICAVTTFDDADLAAALDWLDGRHAELAGAGYLPTERNYAAATAAWRARDFDALTATMEPTFVIEDRAPIGFGTQDRTAWVESHRQLAEMVPDMLPFSTKQYATDRVMIAAMSATGATPDGREVSWPVVCVGVHGDSGRAAKMASFAIEQWDEALALFDEWCAAAEPATIPGPWNLAADRWIELIGCIARGDRDAVRARTSDAFVGLDHRPTVAGPDADADTFLDGALNVSAVFDDIAPEDVIAVRGDRYVLLRGRFESDGFVVPILSLNEVDGDGLATRTVVLDDTDLPAAVYELDQRYLAGEGAEHAWIGLPGADFWRAYNRRDWTRARELLADEMEVVDHRPLSSGSTLQSADQLIEYTQTMIELVPDLVAFDVEHPRIGRRCALSRHLAKGTSAEGAAVELETLVITEMRDGRFVRSETFAPDQLDEALARFEELEGS